MSLRDLFTKRKREPKERKLRVETIGRGPNKQRVVRFTVRDIDSIEVSEAAKANFDSEEIEAIKLAVWNLEYREAYKKAREKLRDPGLFGRVVCDP